MAVLAGSRHSLLLMADGTVQTWGYAGGLAGDGRVWNSKKPVRASGLTDVVSVAAASDHSLAAKSDGTVWTWGSYGGYVPQQMAGLSDVAAVAAGGYDDEGVVLKKDGTVYAMRNEYYPLGMVVQRIQDLTGATAVSSGKEYGLAVRSDGTAWSWWSNVGGKLGDGTYEDRQLVQVLGLTNVVAVAAGRGPELWP